MTPGVRGRAGAFALLVVSLGLALGAAEVGLRFAGYEPLHAVYSQPELFWRYDERLGWALEPGAEGRYAGPRPFPVEFEATIQTNSLGLRGPELGRRAPDELRVLFLGDSLVAGFEVEQAETFVALVEAQLAPRFRVPVRVINAAVRGYGTDQSYLWFREHGRALGADLVIAVFSANDFADNVTLHRPRRPFGKSAFALRPNGALELIGVPVPRYELCSAWVLDGAYRPVRIDGTLSRGACFLQTRLADHSALFTLVATSLARLPGLVRLLQKLALPGEGAAEASLAPWPLRFAQAGGAPGGDPLGDPARARVESELTTALLQALAREVRESGAAFALLMTPRHWERLDTRALRADGIEASYVTISTGVERSLLRFRNDSHWNARGHRLFAQGLTPFVEEELRAVLRKRAGAAR